jgi:hypothetical protein
MFRLGYSVSAHRCGDASLTERTGAERYVLTRVWEKCCFWVFLGSYEFHLSGKMISVKINHFYFFFENLQEVEILKSAKVDN